MPERDVLSYADIAEATGITIGALRKRRSLGRMPAPDFKHGGSPGWYRENMTDWIAENGPGQRRPERTGS